MDRIKPGTKITEFLKKNRYALLVVAAGILLMLIPFGKEEPEQPTQTAALQPREDLASELETILTQIQGAGKVRVMLTVKEGPTTEYQFDEQPVSGTGAVKKDTVIVTDSDRKESALIKRVSPARYLGAVIVCQGADSASVRLSIMEAVSKATGLGADKITVLKMK